MKKWLLAVSAIVFVAIAIVGRFAWNREVETSTFSCISSISQLLSNAKEPQLGPFANLKQGWNAVDDTQSQQLMDQIWGYCDCAGPLWRWKRNRPGFDYWGHRLRVAVKQQQTGGLSYNVWSMGPDGLSGTKDDIVLTGQTLVPAP